MSVESELAEAIELKMPSVSPTMQSDLSTDGDTNTTHPTPVPSDKFMPSSMDAMASEPKAKKRRKQSNPLKIQNPSSPKFDMPSYDLPEQEANDSPLALSMVTGEAECENLVLEKSKTPDYLSLKGSLSRVTNALYNSKLREAVKSSTNSTKSKDSSLQSLTDISSPESTEEHASLVEYKNSVQSVYPQLSMFPVNPVDVARDSLKMNIYGFSDFSSPSFPQGNTNLSISQRSFVTSNGVRVFNPEAYCELCEKEFCNKYFLKTHKANKHGICSVDNNNTGGYNYKISSYKNMQVNPQALQPNVINQMCENGAAFGSADSYCNICQKYFCNKYFLKKHRQNIHGIHEEAYNPSSIHVPVISSPLPLVRGVGYEVNNSSGQSNKDEELKYNHVNLENFKNTLNSTLPLLNGSSPQANLLNKKQVQSINLKDKKSEKFLCELCNIEFCEKCYLDAHRANKHGQAPSSEVTEKIESDKSTRNDDVEESKDPFKDQMCAPCMKNFTSAESFQHHMLEVHGASIKEEEDAPRTPEVLNKKNGQIKLENDGNPTEKSPSSLEMESSNSSTDSGYFNCTFCLMKYSDRKSFLAHLETEHNIIGSASFDPEATVCDVCQEQCHDRSTLITHRVKAHGIVPPFSLEGLPADSLENGDYSAIYSNVKQKGSSFCQICNKELCNKYFMKTHMLKMHGIDVDKVQQDRWPTSPGGGVYCDICQKFLCSKYFLKVHKQNVHGIMDDSLKLSVLGSPSFNNNVSVNEKKVDWQSPDFVANLKVNNSPTDLVASAEGSKGSSVFFCEICGQEFEDKIYLQIHLVDKHVKSSYTNDFPLPDGAKSAMKSDVLPCSCCSFVNLDDSSSASQTNSLESKTISCILCNVTYRNTDYHTHHLSHGVSLPAGTKLSSLENGFHDLGHSENMLGSVDDGKQPRKFKRFRCSKCDKTFRTKSRCVNHIQVTHKSRKGIPGLCEQQSPSKKGALGSMNFPDRKVNSHENGLVGGKEDKESVLSSDFQDGTPLSYQLPKNSDVIMQPFHLSEPAPEGVSKQNLFVPSVVYLPVSKKVSETVTVAFTLTPA